MPFSSPGGAYTPKSFRDPKKQLVGVLWPSPEANFLGGSGLLESHLGRGKGLNTPKK